MLDIILLIIMAVAAVRASLTLRKNRPLFVEFGSSQAIVPLILLFPLGFLVLLVLPVWTGLLPAGIAAVACLLPGLLAQRRARFIFERTGTDRTKPVQDALAIVFITGTGGVVYVVASILIRLLVMKSAPVW